MSNEMERRALTGVRVEMRAEDGKEHPVLTGYAAVFNKDSEPIAGMFIERIDPGAFKKTLAAKADVRALVDHDSGKILGRSKAGTLRLKEDKTGLAVEIDPPDTTAGRDVVESVRRGDLDGMSFAFTTVSDRWETKDKMEVRTLEEVELHDVSVVTYPAYPDTSVALRSRDKAIEEAKAEAEKARVNAAEKQARCEGLAAVRAMLADTAEKRAGNP